MKHILLIVLAFLSLNTSAQQEEVTIEDMMVMKSFLIVHSTTKYSTALKAAEKANDKLGIELNLRGYYPDEMGILITDELCGCGENHGYIPRGRGDDGNYISIEDTRSYTTFKKGLYIVVVASGERDDLNALLPEVRKQYPDAYVKNADIYMGCMH